VNLPDLTLIVIFGVIGRGVLRFICDIVYYCIFFPASLAFVFRAGVICGRNVEDLLNKQIIALQIVFLSVAERSQFTEDNI